MRTDVIPCICCDHQYSAADSVFYGMPQLTCTRDMRWWKIQCPNCGRGGILEFKSPYLAVKDWNKMQTSIR